MTLAPQSVLDRFELPHPGGTGTLTISVARPVASDGAPVPVLVVLDGDMMAGPAAEIARLRGIGGQLPAPMIVAVGYGLADFAAFAQARTADLTPPISKAGRAAMGALSSLVGDKDGGADAFVTFLATTLRQALVARYPEIAGSAHHLFGHSLAGLFVAYALLTRPDAFDGYCINSPSLWWDGFAILQRLPPFRAADPRPRVLVSVGAREQAVPTEVPPGLPMSLDELQAMVAASRMVDAAVEFAAALRAAGLADVGCTVFADEDHSTVIVPALGRAVAFAAPAQH